MQTFFYHDIDEKNILIYSNIKFQNQSINIVCKPKITKVSGCRTLIYWESFWSNLKNAHPNNSYYLKDCTNYIKHILIGSPICQMVGETMYITFGSTFNYSAQAYVYYDFPIHFNFKNQKLRNTNISNYHKLYYCCNQFSMFTVYSRRISSEMFIYFTKMSCLVYDQTKFYLFRQSK